MIQPVDAIITSPPYPGVYDYMAAVKDVADSLGLRSSGPLDVTREIGRRDQWQQAQEE